MKIIIVGAEGDIGKAVCDELRIDLFFAPTDTSLIPEEPIV